ncbi:MAG: glycosyltransferase [Sulfuritalea sp.]|jgi:glycosyltransferase involved in cell wall biosynthesis|nr:glycosyltransferase [Sulfuritalea sp.]
MNFQLVLIKPEGFDFVESLREVMEVAREALVTLGHSARIQTNRIDPDDIAIIFGSHHLDPAAVHRLPPQSIIYNLEQLAPGYPWFSDQYLKILTRFRVWDYSARNVDYLRREGHSPAATHVPFGYSPCLTRIPAAEKEDVDVLFFGVSTERRRRILQALGERGLNVVALTNVWGTERDAWIARAKIVLNMHRADSGEFESVRVLFLLANGKAVVSETAPGEQIEAPLLGAFCAVPYAALVDACVQLAGDSEARLALQQRARAAVMADALRALPWISRATECMEAPGINTGHRIDPLATQQEASNSPHAWSNGFRVAMFGQFRSATGLGTTARHTARSLLEAGVPLTLHNLDSFSPAGDMTEELSALAPYLSSGEMDPDCPVAIYCMPVADFSRLERQTPAKPRPGTLHAGIIWWETTKLHPQWSESLTRLDAVIGYSEFISGVAANTLPLTPVLTGKQPLFLPEGIGPDRARFSLPENATVYLASFDPNSDPVRKNPMAVITAFRQAFANNEPDARLVLRVNHANSTEVGRETLRLLIDAAAGDARIGFAAGPMSYRAVLSLYASADVHVSLHRAEGLGLGMLESMRLGVPVIATGWSGNMTYMDHLSACLVRYSLINVYGSHPHYRPEALGSDAVWADPVIEDAVAWMRHLYLHPDQRRRIGSAGRQKADRYQADALRLNWLHELDEIWSRCGMLPAVPGKYRTGVESE